jgi:UV DNA damage endonuclease
MQKQKKVNFGYACINTCLRKSDIFMSRTCRLDTVRERGIHYVYELAQRNLADLEPIMKWNFENNIFLFRMSSEIFPFATHRDYYLEYESSFESLFGEKLRYLGKLAKEYNQRLTFHPGQFTQLSSDREEVVVNAIREIDFHAKILDMMGCDHNSIIVIHGGSKRGGKEAGLNRLVTNFPRLSSSSQSRLVLENCEMCYSVTDLLPVCKQLKVPLVLDYHHHNINPSKISLEVLTPEILDTWNSRGIKPKFHISESRPGVSITDNITKRRAHSDYITALPEIFYYMVKMSKCGIDLMFEAKMKEQSIALFQKSATKNGAPPATGRHVEDTVAP